jgi:hypothetical protein
MSALAMLSRISTGQTPVLGQRCIILMNDYYEWGNDRSVIHNATAFPLTATVRLAINLAQIAVFLDAFDGGRP